MSAATPGTGLGPFDAALAALCEGPGDVVNPLVRVERGDGTLVWQGALGSARADSQERLTPEHRFHVASIGKTFTAVRLMQLLENGALGSAGLDTRFADLGVLQQRDIARLSCAGSAHYGERITLRQLLTHTAGIRDAMVDDANSLGGPAPGSLVGRMLAQGGNPARHWEPWDPTRPDDVDAGVLNFYLNSGISTAALDEPGRSFHYSDTGFILLGLAIETVGGQPFHRQLRQHVIDPLGLADTYLAYRDDPPGLDARRSGESDCWAGHIPCLSAGASLSFDWAGGGIVSTAASLITFLRGLLTGRLFARPDTAASMQDWLQPAGLEPPRSGVGFGLFRTDSPCGALVGHSGAWGAKMQYCQALDLFLAGTSNQSQGPGDWHWAFLEAASAKP